MTSTRRSSTSAEDDVFRAAPGRNPAGAVYGTVIAGSLIATESSDGVDLPRLVVVVVVTLAVYWIAHAYAELMGQRVSEGRRQTWKDIKRVLRREYAIVGASTVPLLVILVAAALGAREQTAVLVGLWSIVVLLAGWALVAGRRSRLRGLELAVQVLVSTGFGCAVVLLKILLH